MKSPRANGNSRHSARLNKIVFVVTVLWLAASLMLLYPAHPVRPHTTAKEQLALLQPYATARASFM
jgi:hypothetical protein